MITPAYSMTSTERVLPRLALDFTTASLDPRVTITRALNTATCVGSDGYIRTVNADLPRFDYNPSTLACRGLLIEESRINIRSYSEDFSNAVWAPTGLNQTGTPAWVNVAASPANTLTADKLIADTSTGRHRVVGGAQATSSGSRYAMSIFAKKSEYSKIAIGEFNNGTGWASFNLLTGAVIATGGTGSPTASIETYKDDWFRCILTFTAAAFSRFDVYALNDVYTNTDPSSYNFTGDNASGVFVWGAQLELGAFATSYIPNLATGTTTRNADVVSMTGTNFSSWFNASAGTLMVSATGYNAATVAQGGTAPTAVSLYAAAAVNPYATIAIARRDNATLNSPSGFILSDTGSLGADIQKNTVSWVGATVNAAIAWNGSTDAAFTANGLTVGTDTSYTLPTSDSLQIGRWGSETISGYWSGHIRRVSFYPQRLTNAELQAITN